MEEEEGEYYRKLAAPFIAAINVVTRCGPAMNRLLRLRERLLDLMNVQDHLQASSQSCPCNVQDKYIVQFERNTVCNLRQIHFAF